MIKKGFVLFFFYSFVFSQDNLLLRQADTLTSSMIGEETITRLDGNIIFQKKDIILKGSFATQSDKNSIINLYGDVSVSYTHLTLPTKA